MDPVRFAQPSRRALRGSGGAGMFGADVRRRVLRAVGADRDVMLYAARVSVRARWLVWVVAVAELAYRPQLWWATDKQYLLLNVPLVAFNGLVHWRPPQGPQGVVGLAAVAQRHGCGADQCRGRHRRRVPPLQLRGLLPRPGAVRGRVSFPVARRGLDDAGRRGLCRGQRDSGTRSRLRCRPGKGPARQAHGDVRSRRGRQPHRPLRTGQDTGVRETREGAARRAHRALPNHPRHGRADRVPHRPWAYRGP